MSKHHPLVPANELGYHYWICETWHFLGTNLAKGCSFQGVRGPKIIISGQVQRYIESNDMEKRGKGLAVLLHEVGHMLCGHRNDDCRNGGQKEDEATAKAVELILEKYIQEPWANAAFDYWMEWMEG